MENVSVDELARPDLIFQIGIPPLRINVITEIDGVEFDSAWEQRETGLVLGIEATIIGRNALMTNKRAAGRDKDLVDLRRLERNPDDT